MIDEHMCFDVDSNLMIDLSNRCTSDEIQDFHLPSTQIKIRLHELFFLL